MDEIKKLIQRDYPLWVAQQQQIKHPEQWERQINGRLPNCRKITLQEAQNVAMLERLRNITTAQA